MEDTAVGEIRVGITNTTDFKDSYRNLLLQKLPKIYTYNYIKRVKMEFLYNKQSGNAPARYHSLTNKKAKYQ